MTSDAKIGLLLGLVFIFVIAFIINGLPHLKPQASQAEVTTNMVSLDDGHLGLVDTEQDAGDLLNLQDLVDQQTAGLDAFQPAVETEPVVKQPEPATSTDGTGQDVRSMFQLPSKETVDRLAEGFENFVQSVADASKAKVAQETTTEPAPLIDRPTPASASQEAQAARAATVERLRTVVAQSAPRAYVVTDGDNLATVAKKVYGPEEGNRMVNVKRIFEANRQTLKSPDEIFIGQKLVIPPPAEPIAEQDGARSVSPGALFERVQSIGEQHRDPPDKPLPEGRFYLVKEGDSLWKIADSLLGSGARYGEIAKLNPGVLKDENTLSVGMRLRLPSR